MANRTIEIFGWAQSATTCTANVWFNGNVVYSGPVQTVATQPETNPPNGFAEGIITFEVPVNLSGTFPMTITFTGGEQAMVQKINANYARINNPVYTAEQWNIVANVTPSTRVERNAIMIPLAQPPLTAEEVSILENNNTVSPESQAVMNSHGIGFEVSSGSSGFVKTARVSHVKTNVKVNNVDTPAGTEPPGEWGFIVPFTDGTGTISFDLIIDAGME